MGNSIKEDTTPDKIKDIKLKEKSKSDVVQVTYQLSGRKICINIIYAIKIQIQLNAWFEIKKKPLIILIIKEVQINNIRTVVNGNL